MSLKRGSVLGVLVLCLVLIATVKAHAQGVPSQIAALQAQLDQALATISQLQTALAAETNARQAADTTLQNNIDAISGGGITQAQLDAAIAAEAGLRSSADQALQGQIENEVAAREDLADTLSPLLVLAPLANYVTIEAGDNNGLAGPHVVFTGVNVHIRSGHASHDSLTKNGMGNLVVGYNEPSGYAPAERGGSHNIVVGASHRYDFTSGLLVGYGNRLGDHGASVTGGAFNSADGYFSSVTGGRSNQASGIFATVTGGESNLASGSSAAVSAGVNNRATGDLSSVSGGANNQALATTSTVGGGANLTNATPFSFVP